MPGKAKLLFAGNKRPVWRSLPWDKEVFGGDYGLLYYFRYYQSSLNKTLILKLPGAYLFMESELLIKKHTSMLLNAGLNSFERRQHHIPPPPLSILHKEVCQRSPFELKELQSCVNYIEHRYKHPI